jgi:hypothetical protein
VYYLFSNILVENVTANIKHFIIFAPFFTLGLESTKVLGVEPANQRFFYCNSFNSLKKLKKNLLFAALLTYICIEI